MTLRAVPDEHDLAGRILWLLEDAGFYDPDLYEDDDETVAAVKEFITKAANWKAEAERLDALSMRMAERLDKLALDKNTLRDRVRHLETALEDAKARVGTSGGAFC